MTMKIINDGQVTAEISDVDQTITELDAIVNEASAIKDALIAAKGEGKEEIEDIDSAITDFFAKLS